MIKTYIDVCVYTLLIYVYSVNNLFYLDESVIEITTERTMKITFFFMLLVPMETVDDIEKLIYF